MNFIFCILLCQCAGNLTQADPFPLLGDEKHELTETTYYAEQSLIVEKNVEQEETSNSDDLFIVTDKNASVSICFIKQCQ